MLTRVEAFVGEYAAGKSEVAVNRALALRRTGQPVTLVDFDLVEPTYTLRPLKRQLQNQGIDVIAWETEQTMGLGEAGMQLHPEVKGILGRSGYVVCDVGYGVFGSQVLSLVEGLLTSPQLVVYLVVNICRPLTQNVALIVEEGLRFEPLHGLINNTHLGQETTPALVQEGAQVVQAAADRLQLPVVATAALAPIAEQIGEQDCCGNPVWPLKHHMHLAFW